MHMVMPGAIFKKRALIEFIRAQLQEKKIAVTYYSCILMTATRICAVKWSVVWCGSVAGPMVVRDHQSGNTNFQQKI